MNVTVVGATGALGTKIVIRRIEQGDRVGVVGRNACMLWDLEEKSGAAWASEHRAWEVSHHAPQILICAAPLPFLELRRIVLDAQDCGVDSMIVFSGGGVGGSALSGAAVEYMAEKAATVVLCEVAARRLAFKLNTVAPGRIGIGMSAGRETVPGALEKCLVLVDFLCSTESNHIQGRLLSAQWDDLDDLRKRNPMSDDDYRLRRVVPS